MSSVIAHVVSSSVFAALLVVPLAFWWATGDAAFALLALYGMACAAVIEAIKAQTAWWGRPAGARDCGMACGGGRSGGMPGFPSGHVGVTTTVLLATAFLWGVRGVMKGMRLYAWYAAVAVWIGAMCWSRLALRCHDVGQVLGGLAFGVAAAAAYSAAAVSFI